MAQGSRLCKDCRHFLNDYGGLGLKYGKCALTSRTTSPKIDPVDGARLGSTRELSYASLERAAYGECGIDGALYEYEADARVRFRNAWLAPLLDNSKWAAFALAYAVCLIAVFDMIRRGRL